MILSYVAASISLIGILLNIKKNPLCWFLFFLSDSLWLYYFGITRQFAPMGIYVVFLIANYYGYRSWIKDK